MCCCAVATASVSWGPGMATVRARDTLSRGAVADCVWNADDADDGGKDEADAKNARTFTFTVRGVLCRCRCCLLQVVCVCGRSLNRTPNIAFPCERTTLCVRIAPPCDIALDNLLFHKVGPGPRGVASAPAWTLGPPTVRCDSPAVSGVGTASVDLSWASVGVGEHDAPAAGYRVCFREVCASSREWGQRVQVYAQASAATAAGMPPPPFTEVDVGPALSYTVHGASVPPCVLSCRVFVV